MITRKAYGGAYCVMGSKHIRTDMNFAWPTAEIAVMGPEGAVNIVYRRELAAAHDQDASGSRRPRSSASRFANPFIAAERGFMDAVIEPRETRPKLIRALQMLENKVDTMPRKKHGNIPLVRLVSSRRGRVRAESAGFMVPPEMPVYLLYMAQKRRSFFRSVRHSIVCGSGWGLRTPGGNRSGGN